MRIPLQVTFRGMERSVALEERIEELAARLERFSGNIGRCQVSVDRPHQHQQQGEVFEVHILVTVPGREIAVRRSAQRSAAHENAYVAARDAFDAMRRKLAEHERTQRREVKTHEPTPEGRISELHPEPGYGRIETPDGRLIYFHRNSVLGAPFANLSVGDRVRFVEEAGDQGPQASTVHASL